MPVFGDYTTVGEPVAVVEERGHVSTVWQARLSSASVGRLYGLKVYSPRQRSSKTATVDAALERDRRLEFITGIKELKKAQSENGGSMAPVHAFGIAPEGAWFVMDLYPRSLKTWINLRVRADSAALRHLLSNVVACCLALKRSRGFSHGNLKTSNIFLAGKPRPLRKTPLFISDPYPASSSKLADLDSSDREAIGELLGQTMEVQDLRAIGELLLQLVEGRLLANNYDYNYPVERSPAWDHLGREGERWREWCNRLLDPQLSPEKINLEMLEKEFRPGAGAGKLLVVAGGVAAVCLIGGGIFYGISLHGKRKAAAFQNSYQAAADALERTNLTVARQQVDQALEQRPADAQALDLKNKISQALDGQYTSAMESARAQVRAGNLTAAQEFAKRALDYKPADSAATEVITGAEREQKFQATMKDARAAFDSLDYDHAVEFADQAVGIKPDDASAVTLRNQARSKAAAIHDLEDREKKYREAMKDGKAAFDGEDFSNALAQAEVALGNKPDDRDALTLRNDARTKLGEANTRNAHVKEFQQAMTAARNAFEQTNYSNAVRFADQALGIIPKEPSAMKLQEDAKSRLALIQDAEEQDKKYKTAMASARAAMQAKSYDSAIAFCDQALGIKRGDDDAAKLRHEAQTTLDAIKTEREAEKKYQDAMTQARTFFEHTDYSNALSLARQALVTKPNDANAMKLQADAQAKLTAMQAAEQARLDALKRTQELEQKYQTAMKDGQAAFDQGKYDVAEKQANAALALENRNNDAPALELKKQAVDIQAAQSSFAAGNYEDASTVCSRHRGVRAFDDLGKKAALPIQAYSDAYRSFNSGDYSFIDTLEKSDYAKNAKFAGLLASAKSENAILRNLQTLKTNVANWTVVKESVDKLTPDVGAKPPFKEIQKWVEQNDPIKVLEGQLELLRVWFGTRSNDGSIMDPNTHRAATKLAPGTDVDAIRSFEAQLKNKFTQLNQLTPSRKNYFADLEKAMNLW
jgi:hypothetical protein